jgi:hypothetical protein
MTRSSRKAFGFAFKAPHWGAWPTRQRKNKDQPVARGSRLIVRQGGLSVHVCGGNRDSFGESQG